MAKVLENPIPERKVQVLKEEKKVLLEERTYHKIEYELREFVSFVAEHKKKMMEIDETFSDENINKVKDTRRIIQEQYDLLEPYMKEVDEIQKQEYESMKLSMAKKAKESERRKK